MPQPPASPPRPASRTTPILALLLGLLALGLGLGAPLGPSRGVALSVIAGVVAGSVALVLGLGARTQALQTQAPVGLCTAAVAIAVAGTLVCTLWIVLLFGLGPMMQNGPG